MPSDSFLLRIWRAPAAGAAAATWRAKLTRIEDGATQTFTEPAQLLAFLEGKKVGTWHAPEERSATKT